MNRYQFRGGAKLAAGTVEKIVGRAISSPGTEARGAVEEDAGKVEAKAGEVAGKSGRKK